MVVTAIQRTRVELAVEALARYNKPFITEFVSRKKRKKGERAKLDEEDKKLGIPQAKYNKNELSVLIGQIALGEYTGKKKYALTPEVLISHLDRMQETGRQHLYLFRLPEKGLEELLTRLRKPEEVRKILGGEDELYDKGRTVWEARDGPQLALVRFDPALGSAEPRFLVMKWIETRVYYKPKVDPVPTSDSQPLTEEERVEQEERELDEAEEAEEAEEEERERQVERVHISVPHEERAASFLVIHLDSGDCELRIQAVRGRARRARENQLATYTTLIADLFGFELVGPTVLLPAIHRALILREVPIVRCEAILPDGAQYIGRKKGQLPPVDVRELQAGVIIRFDWSQPIFGVGRAELDGRLDEIGILRPLSPEYHRKLLDRVRRWRQEGLGVVESNAEGDLSAQPPIGSRVGRDPVVPLTWDALAILKALLGPSVRSEAPASQPEIDRAIRAYAHTHPVQEPGATPTTGATGATVPSASAAADARSLEQFLHYISEVAKSERSMYQREIKLAHGQEKWYFRLLVVAAALALSVVTTGAFLLIFFPAKLAIGTITGILGLVTGRGTLITRSSMKSLRAKRELIERQQRDSHDTLLAIQAALSIPDPAARSRAMADVSSILLNRVPGLVPSRQKDEEKDPG